MSPSVIEEAREALRVFLGCSYKVDTSIDPRGYSWSEAWLDEARPIASRALAALNEGAVSGLTEEEAVRKLATVIAHAMFSEGEKSPTVAGYQRAARAALEALKGDAP